MLAYNKGKLVKWHDDRGYGFIEPENNAKQVFLHISVLRRRAERRPQEGDVIWYQLDMDSQDRIQASNAYIEGISYGSMKTRAVSEDRKKDSRPAAIRMTQEHKSPDLTPQMSWKRDKREPRIREQSQRSTTMEQFQKHRIYQKTWLYVTIILVIIGFFVLKGVLSTMTTELSKDTSSNRTSSTSSSSQTFQCAGKTRCNEMSSCEEAMFYLNNCPNTQMDGDGDRIPCEDALCGH